MSKTKNVNINNQIDKIDYSNTNDDEMNKLFTVLVKKVYRD